MGAINGALVAWVRIPSIVVTLATMVALRDGLRWATQGAWVQDLPPGFQWFGQSQAASEIITIGCAAVLTVGVSWGLRNLAGGPRGVRHRSRLRSGAPGGHRSGARGLRGLRHHGRADRLRRGVQRGALQPDSEQRRASAWR